MGTGFFLDFLYVFILLFIPVFLAGSYYKIPFLFLILISAVIAALIKWIQRLR